MVNILKYTTITIIALIVLLIVGLGLLMTLVSPNHFKPIIEAQVKEVTGRQLVIDGDLSWSFLPYLNVKVGHMKLNNLPSFKQTVFLEVDRANVGVKLLPLLSGRVESSGVSLSGVKVFLIKNTNGQANWEQLVKKLKVDNDIRNTKPLHAPEAKKVLFNQATDAAPTEHKSEISTTTNAGNDDAVTELAVTTDNKKFVNLVLEIPKVDVSNAMIEFSDEEAQRHSVINDFEFHAKNVKLDQPFDIESRFKFSNDQPIAAGKANLKGTVKLDLKHNAYYVNGLDLKLNLQQQKKSFDLHIAGDFATDLAENTISFTDFSANVANLELNGTVNIASFNHRPTIKGHLIAPAFDLKKLLQALGHDSVDLQQAQNVTANFNFATNPDISSSILQALIIQGQVSIATLQAAKIKATQIIIQAVLEDGTLQFLPIKANLYQGILESQAKINLVPNVPQLNFHAKLDQVQAEPLIQDLGGVAGKFKIKGAANVDLQISSAGMTADQIVRAMNGNARFSFNNGIIDGINIGYWIDRAYAYLKNQNAPVEGENLTHFGTLTGTAIIKNGVVTNNDLKVTSPKFDTTGQGTIDLVSNKIDYLLQTTPHNIAENHEDKNLLNLYNAGIPLRVTGDLQNPAISLDVKVLAEEFAKQQVKNAQDNVKDKIRDQLKDKVKGQAGELLQNLLGN